MKNIFRKLFKSTAILKEINLLQKSFNNIIELPYALVKKENIIAKGDIYDDYKSLIKGLDEESIYNINKLLGTLLSCKSIKSKPNFVRININNKDRQMLNELSADFYSIILKLNDECFVYKDYFLPINHFEASVFYFMHGLNTIQNTDLIKTKDIIDVGGFIGDSALIFSRYTDNKIYCFEPLDANYNLMQKTIKLNDSTKIIPIKKGLGAKNETLELTINGSASSIIGSQNYNTEKIEITTLDEFVDQHNIEVGLIKVDIEGFEQQFLIGAEKTIKSQQPILLISIYHSIDDFLYIKPLLERWNLNYKFKIYSPIQPQLFTEILLIAEPS